MEKPAGESDLDKLIKNMDPVLEDEELVFCTLPPEETDEYLLICQGYYVEREGVTVIISKHLADIYNLNYQLVFKRITLNVHSSLAAVGFLARITEVLSAQGFSVNVISAYYHDHLYIQSFQAEDGLSTLLLWRDKLAGDQ